jgi:hypothetical protein
MPIVSHFADFLSTQTSGTHVMLPIQFNKFIHFSSTWPILPTAVNPSSHPTSSGSTDYEGTNYRGTRH